MELDEPRLFPPALKLEFEEDRLIPQGIDIRGLIKRTDRIRATHEWPRFTNSYAS